MVNKRREECSNQSKVSFTIKEMKSRKAIRLLFLMSRYNQIYLNEIDGFNKREEYSKYVGLHKTTRLFNLSQREILFTFYAYISLILFPLYLFIKLCRALCCKIKTEPRVLEKSKYFLSTSIALKRVSTHAKLYADDSFWLEIPWSYTEDILDTQRITVFNCVKYGDIFNSFCDSILLYFYVLKRDGIKYVFLNSYCIEWFLYYYALIKIPAGSKLYFCSHKDRWSTLLDSINGSEKTLIQHGTEIIKFNHTGISKPYFNYVNEYAFWTMNLPCKYKNIDMLYTFSNEEYEAMCSSVISFRPPKVVMGYAFNLFPIEKNRFSVLIIGFYREYADIERKLLDVLSKCDVDIYLKNHPTVSEECYDEMRKIYDFNFINNPIFPDVDIVLSYESTLALEYKQVGVQVYYYDELPLNESDLYYFIEDKKNSLPHGKQL